MTAVATPPKSRARLAIPPQHGAWAFLALPLLLGFSLTGVTWLGVVFAVTWVLAYPVSYYFGRAVAARLRRGRWTTLAHREIARGRPWAVAAAAGGVVLLVTRPALIAVAPVFALLWWLSLQLSLHGRERGFTNDVLLIGQALAALPLLAWVQDGTVPANIWWAVLICGTYFVGSVIHVKSLLREADDRRWHAGNIGFHVVALAWGLFSVWLFVPFAAALTRSLILRPGTRPGIIGAVETVVSIVVLVCSILALG